MTPVPLLRKWGMITTRTHEDIDAYSIARFIERNSISRAYLYQLWSEGHGPRYMQLGRRRLISREAAAEWRRRMEAETEQSA